jgi:hypothetical protein
VQEFDIAIEGDGQDPTNPMNGIRYYQGGNGNDVNPFSAGNSFTHPCTGSESHLYNNTINPFEYYHLNTFFEKPVCYSSNVTPSYNFVSNNSCLTKITSYDGSSLLSSNQKSLLLADFAIKNSQFLAIAIVYNNVIDNGNTQNLLQSIAMANPIDANELRNTMLNNSPNLSDLVVQDLIRSNTIIQNSDLLTIITANPDVSRNEELLRMLSDKVNPMDDWMIEFIREVGTYETNRTLLEQTFAQKQFEREEIAWQMVRHLLNDTITDSLNHNELHQWLYTIGSPRAKYMIAEDYASSCNFNAASQVLENIQERYLDRYEILELNGMKQWLSMQESLFNEGRTIYDLTTAELDEIRPMADEERMYGLAGTYAANVLNHFEPRRNRLQNIYPERMRKASKSNSNGEVKKKRTIKKLGSKISIPKPDLLVYPNPINNELIVDLNKMTDVGIINVYSSEGMLVLTKNISNEKLLKLNFNNLANGNYSLEVLDLKGNMIKLEKLIVQHH